MCIYKEFFHADALIKESYSHIKKIKQSINQTTFTLSTKERINMKATLKKELVAE